MKLHKKLKINTVTGRENANVTVSTLNVIRIAGYSKTGKNNYKPIL
jgi:hypothetical protein